MVSVWIVDNSTRMKLPGTAWGNAVVESLTEKGHTVVLTNQDHESVVRSEAEMAAVDALLEEAAAPHS